MDKRTATSGHASAALTIFVWGTTFISIKVLLEAFSPVEILLFRMALAYLALLIVRPQRLPFRSWREELQFAAAGLCGVTLYFIFQNTALTYTQASNVGILISTAPFFTAILSHFFLKDEPLGFHFFLGFAVSIAGIILISYNGNFVLRLNPLGDLLTLLAAGVWAIYSILMRKISARGYSTVQVTRKVFFYGLLFILPALGWFDFRLDLERFARLPNLLNMAFLGIVASALCYVTWNYAVGVLGALRTSVYIYAIPLVTIVVSVIVLHERVTPVAFLGVALILSGLWLSERRGARPTEAVLRPVLVESDEPPVGGRSLRRAGAKNEEG